MTKTYKECTIDRNMNGDWIVTYRDGTHSQHRTISEAKDAISYKYEAS